MLSMHTSPLAALGGKETGGMNVYVRELSRSLGARGWQVDILTIGQYLQPSRSHLKVEHYYTLEEFAELKRFGEEIGFRWVESHPLVRSSYHAAEQVHALSAVHQQLYG